jgi:hypothetical protein
MQGNSGHMSKISLKEALNYFDTFCEFVIKRDIPTAIDGGALYLAALGLSTYTLFIYFIYNNAGCIGWETLSEKELLNNIGKKLKSANGLVLGFGTS